MLGTRQLSCVAGITASGEDHMDPKPMRIPMFMPSLQARRDLFKPLRVHFIGEDGIDAGERAVPCTAWL